MELEAHPALDKLTSKISTLNLERVRQIKSRLVAITGRVQKVGWFEIVDPHLFFPQSGVQAIGVTALCPTMPFFSTHIAVIHFQLPS